MKAFMTRKLRITIGVIITIALTLGGLWSLTSRMALKTSVNKYSEFYAEAKKHNVDVVLAGSSHMIDGVYPMELWDDYGIVSYNLGIHGSLIPTTYWTVKNMLDYNTPRLVVLDCALAYEEIKTNETYSFVHQAFDAVPLSVNKLKAIYDLLDDPVMDEKINSGEVVVTEKRIPGGLIWNYSVYHGRYDELNEEDFEKYENRTKGAELKVTVATPNKIPEYNDDCYLSEETVGIEYLRKTIELCKENNIDILLTYIPFPYVEADIETANTISRIAAEYDVNFINFLNMDLVNYDTDMFDEYSHLNVSGANKVTKYIGEFINENYDIPDNRNNPEFASWNDALYQYEKELVNLISISESFEEGLMLINYDKYRSVVSVKDSKVLDDRRIADLLDNANTMGITEVLTDDSQPCDYIIDVYNRESGELYIHKEY